MNAGKVLKAVATIFVFGGIISGTILVQKNQDIRREAATTPNLHIRSSHKNIKKGDRINLQVFLDSKDKEVKDVDFEINFDPNIFEAEKIDRGDEVTGYTEKSNDWIDNQNGVVHCRISATDYSKYIKGSNIDVATITLRSKTEAKNGKYSFKFKNRSDMITLSNGQTTEANSEPEEVEVEDNTNGTDQIDQQGGSNQESGDVNNILKQGDVNQDGHVNVVDIGIIVDNYKGKTLKDIRSDVNKDDVVDIVDIGIVVDNYEN